MARTPAPRKRAAKRPEGSPLDGFFEAVGERFGDLFGRVDSVEKDVTHIDERVTAAESSVSEHERRIVELENPQYDAAKLRLITGEIRALK